MRSDALYHFSTDPHIKRFVPHVPRPNPSHSPAVWAIDADHAPLYWFPRDCPRVTVWSRDPVRFVPWEDASGQWISEVDVTPTYAFLGDFETLGRTEARLLQYVTDETN